MLPSRAFGSRFLSFGVAMIIVAILIAVLLPKLSRDLDNLEQSRFDFRLEELETAVRFKLLEMQARGTLHEVKTLVGANPYRWLKGRLQDKPAHYLGEVKLGEVKLGEPRFEDSKSFDEKTNELNPAPSAIVPANWFYDTRLGRVIYLTKAELAYQDKRYQQDTCLAFKVVGVGQGPSVESLRFEFQGASPWEFCSKAASAR